MSRRSILTGALAMVSTFALAATAFGASFPSWEAPNGGVSVKGNTVTLDNVTDEPEFGVSWEAQGVEIPIENGDTIRFDYNGKYGGGAPRVFVQGGAFNTFDGFQDDPGEPLGDGWFRITREISGVTAGDAGYVGIVNDQVNDRSTMQVRHLKIAGERVSMKNRKNRD